MSSDAIVILKADHKEIRGLFRKFQAAGDKAVKTKERIVGQIIELLTVHTYIENEVMYPEVCALLPDLKDDVLESYEEHHVADVLCMELASMPAGAERFDAKATVLIENVTHHIEEEEQDWFPKVRAGLSRKQLQELGAKLEQARKKAPRSPAQPSTLKKTIERRHRLTSSTPPLCRRRTRPTAIRSCRPVSGRGPAWKRSAAGKRSSVTPAAASATNATAPPLSTRPCTASSASLPPRSPPPHETASTTPRMTPGQGGHSATFAPAGGTAGRPA